MKNMFKIVVVSLVVSIIGLGSSFGADGSRGMGMGLNLTEKQYKDLQGLVNEYTRKSISIMDQIDIKAFELKQELRRVDRFKNKFTEYNSVYRANQLVRELSNLRSEQIKLKTSYLLKAKDILTIEQRLKVIERILEFEGAMPEETFFIVEHQILELDLGLSVDQVKKIMRHRADMEKKAIDLDLKIDMQMIDLQVVLAKPDIDTEKINTIIMSVTDLMTQLMDNRVVHFLKAKDVLTTEQKQLVLHLLGL